MSDVLTIFAISGSIFIFFVWNGKREKRKEREAYEKGKLAAAGQIS